MDIPSLKRPYQQFTSVSFDSNPVISLGNELFLPPLAKKPRTSSGLSPVKKRGHYTCKVCGAFSNHIASSHCKQLLAMWELRGSPALREWALNSIITRNGLDQSLLDSQIDVSSPRDRSNPNLCAGHMCYLLLLHKSSIINANSLNIEQVWQWAEMLSHGGTTSVDSPPSSVILEGFTRPPAIHLGKSEPAPGTISLKNTQSVCAKTSPISDKKATQTPPAPHTAQNFLDSAQLSVMLPRCHHAAVLQFIAHLLAGGDPANFVYTAPRVSALQDPVNSPQTEPISSPSSTKSPESPPVLVIPAVVPNKPEQPPADRQLAELENPNAPDLVSPASNPSPSAQLVTPSVLVPPLIPITAPAITVTSLQNTNTQ